MEGSSSPPSDSNRTVNINASKFLSNLPSRGLFSSTVLSSNPGGMRIYTCVHNTDPPESQQIKTNQQNILIRSLTLRNKKADIKDTKSAGATESSRKRTAERVLDSRASSKRANSQSTTARQEGTSGVTLSKDFQGLTVERLRALLKAKGLSMRGKKDELIGRLNSGGSS